MKLRPHTWPGLETNSIEVVMRPLDFLHTRFSILMMEINIPRLMFSLTLSNDLFLSSEVLSLLVCLPDLCNFKIMGPDSEKDILFQTKAKYHLST